MQINDDLLKNDVPANGQVTENGCISLCLQENANLKVLFLGNSITRHGVAEAIGWRGDWGMAAIADRIYRALQDRGGDEKADERGGDVVGR